LKAGFGSWIDNVSLVLQWWSVLPDAKDVGVIPLGVVSGGFGMVCNGRRDVWSFLAGDLGCSVFLSWSRRFSFVLPMWKSLQSQQLAL